MTLHIKTFDTGTRSGLENPVNFEMKNPDWRLLTSRIDLVWYFELKEIEGKAYSNELDRWVPITNFNI